MRRNPVHTPFAERLGVDNAILGFTHTPEVAGAITKAGGLGVYGIAHDAPPDVAGKLEQLRSWSGDDAPLGIDIMMPKGMPEDETLESVQARLPEEHKQFVASIRERYEVPPSTTKSFFNSTLRTPAYFEGQLQALLDSDVDLVAFGVGLTADAVLRLKEAGKTVGALVGHPRHVERYLDLPVGLDFLVAQGSEAGAHTGTIGTMVLVPQVVQMAGDIPVLAAGGIGHGSQIAASLVMGAQGVWLGTAWLASEEATRGDHSVSDTVRAKLFAAGSGDTAITKGNSGKPQRQIRTKWIEEWESPEAPAPLPMPYQHALVGDLMTSINDHDVEPLAHTPAGQGVAWTTEMRPVADIMAELVDQTDEALNRLR